MALSEIILGESSKGVEFTLVWTNPQTTSPSSGGTTFAAQTVSMDLKGYDAVCIVVCGRTYGGDPPKNTFNRGRFANNFVTMDTTARIVCGIGGVGATSTTATGGGERDVTVTETGITFGAPQYYKDGSVPYQVWGVRGFEMPLEISPQGTANLQP